MTGASLLGGAALAAMGLATEPAFYLAAWVALGAAMSGLLYEPAFAVIMSHFGGRYRKGIVLVTLVGGFASTVFIPLGQVAVEALGWRMALMALGGLEILVCVPLHAFGLPRGSARPAVAMAGAKAWPSIRPWWRELGRHLSDRRFLGLALWYAAHAAAFSGLIFQLVPILQQAAVPTGTLMQAIALIGPMQVLGRLALAGFGDRIDSLVLAKWSMTALCASAASLLAFPPSLLGLALFAVLYGASNGVVTILRGTAVAEVFGRDRYAELSGALALPTLLAKAVSPLAMAALWAYTGSSDAVFALVMGLSVVALGGIQLAARPRRSQTKAEECCAVASGGR